MNIVNRKVADECIHVVDAVSIGEEMALDFVKSLPDGFHNHLKNKVKTMETMKLGVVVGVETSTSQLYSNMSCVQCLHLSLTSLIGIRRTHRLA